jgi:hypothetical protein
MIKGLPQLFYFDASDRRKKMLARLKLVLTLSYCMAAFENDLHVDLKYLLLFLAGIAFCVVVSGMIILAHVALHCFCS